MFRSKRRVHVVGKGSVNKYFLSWPYNNFYRVVHFIVEFFDETNKYVQCSIFVLCRHTSMTRKINTKYRSPKYNSLVKSEI